jgi:hypothetical protein
MARPVLALALLLGGTPSLAQPAAEGAHRGNDGPPNLCGITAATIPALEAMIAVQFSPLPGDERYISYEDPAHRRLWTFTTAAHPAHPAASCMTVVRRDGRIGVNREISCPSTRASCALLRREFEALDAANSRRFQAR